ncbi:hypothetical protein [Nocardia sp. NPDC050710]|uniref:hypothetical protein n=1 Tax=Nocardia sp. NPDC050710 TaxID=3157220 RepID=UPI0033EC64E8
MLVVEHSSDVIAIADHIVDIGPGIDGGRVVLQGCIEKLRTSGTLTIVNLRRARPVKARTPTGWLTIRGTRHNLRDVTARFPTGVLTVVAGSGKSTLILLPAAGNTVIAIEHDLEVINRADWIIDLGRDVGKHSGDIVFTGTPATMLADPGSLTAE